MFGRRKPDEAVMCGGTTRRYDAGAPKTITSNNMILFDVHSRVRDYIDPADIPKGKKLITSIEAFAVKSKQGSLLRLCVNKDRYTRNTDEVYAGHVKEDIFPKLTAMAKEENMAAENGRYSFTHGLPEDFGGSIRVKFMSGEYINVTCNQSPVITTNTADRIWNIFSKALEGEKVERPDVSEITKIYFEELYKDGFRRVTLDITEDGCECFKSAKYSADSKLYESRTEFAKEELSKILDIVDKHDILTLEGLPREFTEISGGKTLEFTLKNGRKIAVLSDFVVPRAIHDKLFKIEMALK